MLELRSYPNDGSRDGGYQMYQTPEGLRLAVMRSMQALSPISEHFDAIMVTGQSGIIPGAIVAFLMHKQLIVVRKTDAQGNHHSHGAALEGVAINHRPRIVFLDDFVSTGNTIKRLMDALLFIPEYTLVALALYGHPRGEAEIDAGYAKEFFIYNKKGQEQKYHMTRWNPDSLLFHITLQAPGVNLPDHGGGKVRFSNPFMEQAYAAALAYRTCAASSPPPAPTPAS